ncbi:bifunctional DNA primase/polymerase [Priestia endophytica]
MNAIKKGKGTNISESQNNNLKAAIAYSQMLNWKLFPIHHKSKIPITKRGFYAATNDVEQITKWYTDNPKAGIGLPTGEVNNLIVLDIDPRNGGDVSLESLISEYGKLPGTVHCFTGGGGEHYYFNNDKRITKSKLDDYPGIDIQGNGKYVVLPPSTHPSGKKYEWEMSSKPVITPIADIPNFFLDLLQKKSQSITNKMTGRSYLNILKGVTNGARNDSMMSLIGYLLAKKIDYRIAYELVMLWNSRNEPPLEAATVTTAFNNMLRKEAAKKR